MALRCWNLCKFQATRVLRLEIPLAIVSSVFSRWSERCQRLKILALRATENAQQEQEEVEEVQVERKRSQDAQFPCELRAFAFDAWVRSQAGNLLGVIGG